MTDAAHPLAARRAFSAPVVITLLIGMMGGCTNLVLPDWIPQEKQSAEIAPPSDFSGSATSTRSGIPVADATQASELDQSTAAARQQASQTTSGARPLGSTIASLGDATEPGFWLKTPLVDAQTPGVLRSKATGMTAQVTLLPIEGPATAGSRVSLSAMRLLEVPLTELVELEVATRG